MTLLPILLAAVFPDRHWELSFQNRSLELFPPIAALMQNLLERCRDILE